MSNDFLTKLNLQFFADDNNDSTNDNTDVNDDYDTTVDEPDNKPDNNDGKPKDKTFTQSELEEIIAKRLERERKKYEGFDELKKKASEYEQQLEEKRLAELSEKERAEEIAKKAQEEKSSLEQELDKLRESVKQEKITNEFIKVATSANVQYIDDAIKLADLSAVTVNEEGIVEGMADVIKSLVEHKPYLVAKKQTKPIGDSTNSNNDKSDKSAEQLIKEAADKARKSGKAEDIAAYSKLKRELGV